MCKWRGICRFWWWYSGRSCRLTTPAGWSRCYLSFLASFQCSNILGIVLSNILGTVLSNVLGIAPQTCLLSSLIPPTTAAGSLWGVSTLFPCGVWGTGSLCSVHGCAPSLALCFLR